MPPSKVRYVTICQQLLAIAAVIAVLAPAANVLSLDVIASGPAQVAPSTDPAPEPDAAADPQASPPAKAQAPNRTAPVAPATPKAPKALVETAPVETQVAEVPLAPVSNAGRKSVVPDETDAKARTESDEPSTEEPTADEPQAPAGGTGDTVESAPEAVTGYGAVGVTWSADSAALEEGEISVQVRTNTDGAWSDWIDVDYHDHDGPDPDSAEGRNARPGTDAMFVGEVDQVQARAVTAAGIALPDDIKLAVITPGDSAGTELERPAIDTNELAAPRATTDAPAGDDATPPSTDDSTLESSEGDLELSKSSYTEKPQIFSRAQWGANEKLRDGSPSYHEVHAGFVHHTVNANNYTKAQVPAMIRSIYAYHTQTRGWSDVGYNFLVDRFGRIWEGRYGGVDRPVVGAHTLGYNENSFAMSAIGNFDITKPSEPMVQAYGALMAWKLALHGVDAASTKQVVGSKTFKAINGHRDAGSTACPGKYLYARIGDIRKLAAGHQADWRGRDLVTNVVGSSHPDLLMRQKSSGRVYAVPTGGMLKWSAPVNTAGYAGYDVVIAAGDLTGDRRGDIFVRSSKTGRTVTLAGDGNGRFTSTNRVQGGLRGRDQITAVGDLNGDGRNDIVARDASTGRLYGYWGKGNGAFRGKVLLSTGWKGYTMTVGAGDANGDGKADLLARDAAGKMWLHPGNGKGGLGARVAVHRTWGGFDKITGIGDFDGDGKADLLMRYTKNQRFYIRPGAGNGRYKKLLGPFNSLKGARAVSAAPVTGSAHPDLVTVTGSTLSVIPHAGTVNVSPPVYLGSGFNGSEMLLNVGDWDRDGRNDVISKTANGDLRLHRNLGGNKFAAPVRIGTGFNTVTLLAAVGDVTGDGYPDLMAQPKKSSMRIYPGKATGFLPSYVAKGPISGTEQLGLGRWNADGAPDVAYRVGDGLRWYKGNGPGGLVGSAGKLSVDLSPYDLVTSPGDVDGNGRPDLVAVERKTGHLYLLPGTSSGFGTRVYLGQGYGGFDRIG
ncbi:FG-GAP-like repeat-containing protein [Nocardioides sp. Bht2]|uniref:FG-GAP-like repeat-containing protein n=1 Tax=Nocardioides sp. Bht2 TaxID=3392297 RepID=UPI0039B3D1AD